MATRLLQTLAFGSIAAGASSALAHDINLNGTAVKPDLVLSDVDGLTIVVTTTTVTVTNNNSVAVSPTLLLERFHSTSRQLGGGITDLTPQPVVIQGSSGGAAGAGARLIAVGTVNVAGAFVAQKGFNSVSIGLPGQYTAVLTDPPADYTKLAVIATLQDAGSNGGEISYTLPGTPNIAIQTFDDTGTLASSAFSISVYDLT